MRQLVHRYRERFKPAAVILLYHRVIELPSDPYLLSVSPRHFAEHLAVLRKQTRPISLRQLVGGLRDGNVPRRAVVITFDDGYFDNLVYAKPLLEQYDIPATVFVTAGSLPDASEEFWWDTLEKILLQPRSLPQKLRLVVAGVPCEWQSDLESGSGKYAYDGSWNYGRKDDPTPRHTIFRSVHQLLKPLEENERRKVLQDLAAWASADTAVRPTHRLLSGAETVQLTEGRLVEVGAHTMTHPVLSSLPLLKQRDEICQSKLRLQELIGEPVGSFAYPHGLDSDFTQETMTLAREAGFDCACAAIPGIIHRGANGYRLPRFMVRDVDGDEFAERLSGYFYA